MHTTLMPIRELLGVEVEGSIEIAGHGEGTDPRVLLTDNPVSLVDWRFRVPGEEWEDLLGLPRAGLEVAPLCRFDPSFRLVVELQWDDAFAQTVATSVIVEPWAVRPCVGGEPPDVVVAADWWRLIAWMHDSATLLGHLMLRGDCTVTGDLWALAAIEGVVSSERRTPGVSPLPLLVHLEQRARRW